MEDMGENNLTAPELSAFTVKTDTRKLKRARIPASEKYGLPVTQRPASSRNKIDAEYNNKHPPFISRQQSFLQVFQSLPHMFPWLNPVCQQQNLLQLEPGTGLSYCFFIIPSREKGGHFPHDSALLEDADLKLTCFFHRRKPLFHSDSPPRGKTLSPGGGANPFTNIIVNLLPEVYKPGRFHGEFCHA